MDEAHALEAVGRPKASPSAPAESGAEAAPLSQDQLSGRRSRNAEALRKQLRDLAAGLGARDLDRVLTFAEFVKARRVARSYSQRHEVTGAEPAEAASPSSVPPAASENESNGGEDQLPS